MYKRQVIVIDPRKNDTVLALDARWIPIRPATDSALADAMAYVIIKEGLQDQGFLDTCCLGFDAAHMPEDVDPSLNCLSYLMGENDGIPKTPEWGEKITGIPADTIRELAIRYATTKPAAIIQGYGAQRNASVSYTHLVTVSTMAGIKPKITEKRVEPMTIYTVCPKAFIITSYIFKHLP